MKTALKLILILILSLIQVSPAFAQADTEEEHTLNLEEQLLLSLPDMTENPNHTLNFTDPSGKGVYLQIDGKGYQKIASPYALPTLGIGKHSLSFKFHDKEETEQIIDRTLYVIPRIPQIKAPEVQDSYIVLNGTGIAGGSIEIFMTNGAKNLKGEASIDTVGEWTYKTEEQVANGRWIIIANARKNGFSSRYSEPVNVLVGTELICTSDTQSNETKLPAPLFEFKSMSPEYLKTFFLSNRDLDITIGTMLVVGILFGFIFRNSFYSKENKKAETLLRDALIGNTKGKLKEKLQNGGIKEVTVETIAAEDKPQKKKKDIFGFLKKKKKADMLGKVDSKAKDEKIKANKKEKETKTETVPVENIEAIEKKPETAASEEKKEETVQIDELKEEDIAKDKDNKDLQKSFVQIDTDIDKDISKKKKEEAQKKKKQEKKPDAKGKTITKEQFLNSFKAYDPDDKNGKEIPQSPDQKKRNIKITLTSDKLE